MKTIFQRDFEAALPRPCVGCALQGAQAIAMAVRGGRDGWWVNWCLDGSLRDRGFAAELASRVGKTPFWVTPTRKSGAMNHFSLAIDVPEGAEFQKAALLQTQVEQRFNSVAESVVLCGAEIAGPGRRHLVGGGAVKSAILSDVKNWRARKIAAPHVASPVAALANLFSQLCPDNVLADGVCRIVVAPGEATVVSCVMDEWRLVDGVEYQLLEGQEVEPQLVREWIDFVRGSHPTLSSDPVPLLLAPEGATGASFPVWDPFANANVHVEPSALEPVRRRFGPACIAFGMALQGGN